MTSRSAALERLSIAGPAGALQAVAEGPLEPAPDYAVVCHPHPLFGGTMDNKVVATLARALRDTGIPTLRFNFRGVAQSEGTFDEGTGRNRGCGRRRLVRSAALAGPPTGACRILLRRVRGIALGTASASCLG